MANKYKSWNKCMWTFTIPSTIQGKTIKKGRYTKLRYLLDLRAYISKQINNTKLNIKYFSNIELGEHYSNPHLHLQLWIENKSDLETLQGIYLKSIDKYSLNQKRCEISYPEKEIEVYHYVIKDYSKNLSDKDIWDLETQKKRMRKFLGNKIKFWNKSRDDYSKKVYRIFYYSYNTKREFVRDRISFFNSCFFYVKDKKDLLCFGSWWVDCSELSYIEQEIKEIQQQNEFHHWIYGFT